MYNMRVRVFVSGILSLSQQTRETVPILFLLGQRGVPWANNTPPLARRRLYSRIPHSHIVINSAI